MKKILLFFVLIWSVSFVFGQVEVLNEDFNSGAQPAGWTTDATDAAYAGAVGACGTAGVLFSFDCTDGSNFSADDNNAFSGNIAVINDDDVGSAFVGVGYIISPVMDLTAGGVQLTFDWTFDGFLDAEFAVEGWDGAAWTQLFSYIGDDAQGSETIDLSAFTNADFQLRFSYDDNGHWNWGVGFDNVLVTANAPAQGNGPTCSIHCPNDVVFNLDPGACTAIADYPVWLEGQCDPVVVPGQVINDFTGDFDPSAFAEYDPNTDGFPPDWTTAWTLNGPASTYGPNMIDLAGLPATLTLEGYDDDASCPGDGDQAWWNYTMVNYIAPFDGTLEFDWDYTTDDSWGAYWDPFGYMIGGQFNDNDISDVFGAAAQNGHFTIQLQAGDNIAFYVKTEDFFDCGASATMSNFTFTEPDQVAPYVLAQVAGPAEGDELTIAGSPYDVEYQLTAPNGSVAGTCSFQVFVNEFANPTHSLACNSDIQITLDENCTADVGADMILEGGPYGCYDNYDVQILGAQGQNLGHIADGSFIGHSYNVTVTDPTGNFSCMASNVTFEDQTAPTLECDVTAAVTSTNGVLELTPTFDGTQSCFNFSSFTDGTQPYSTFSFSVATAGNYTFTMNAAYDGLAFLVDGTFDPANPCDGFIAGDDDGGPGLNPMIAVALTPGDYTLVTTNTTWGNGSGPFSWTFAGGEILTTSSEFTITCLEDLNSIPYPIAHDNCDPSPDVQMIDNWYIDNEYCDANGEKILLRTFKAVDWNGMESEVCTQTIHITRFDITIPADVTYTCDEYAANPSIIDATAAGAGIPTGYQGSESVCEWNYSYSDLTLDHCGPGTFKIIRTWTILDLCSNTVYRRDQVIVVDDVEGPTFDFSNNPAFTEENGEIVLTVSANEPAQPPMSCRSTEFIPAPEYTDNCSGAVSLQIFTSAGEVVNYQTAGGIVLGGYLPEPGLAIGEYYVLYQAVDACGNVGEYFITLRVVDDITPDVVCETIHNVTLNNTGVNTTYAETFDDGTTDNCCIDHFEVRRMDGGAFGPSVQFDCSDIGSPVTVVFRAYDCYGNYSDCMVDVNVSDKTNPTCLAPADMTLTCLDLPGNLDIYDHEVANEYFGTPNAVDNCSAEIQYLSVIDTRNECGVGRITRRFRAVDAYGNTSDGTCSQIIDINEVHDYTIHIPNDVQSTDCSLGNVPALTVDSDGCDIIGINVDDQILNISTDGACYKILRTYTILNECVWDGVSAAEVLPRDGAHTYHMTSNQGGYYTYTQYIKVDDDVAPEFDAYAGDTEFCAGLENNDCSGPVNVSVSASDACTTDMTYTWTLFDDVDGDGFFIEAAPHNDEVIATGSGNSYSNTLEVGHYGLSFIAEDGCGNTAEQIVIFDVKDCKNPTISCDELVVELMNSDPAMFVVTPDMYLQPCPGCGAAVTDNCPGELKLSFSANTNDTERTYGCDDLGAGNPIEIWVTDAAGNQTYCLTNTIVQANDGQCTTPGGPHVGGVLATELDNGIADVAVQLNGTFDATTNTDGEYDVEVEENADVTVVPQLDNNTHAYVSTMDLVAIRDHILGTRAFTTPYQWIAADANGSHSVTGLDMVEIRRYILWDENYQNGFPNVTTWRFVDADYQFPEGNPLSVDFPEVINYNNVTEDLMNGDFVGVVIGDLDGSYDNSLLGSEERSVGEFVMNANDAVVTAGETYTVDFTAQDLNVKGYQFTLNFDAEALEFDGILPGVAKAENFGLAFVEDGFITTSWNGEASDDVLFSVTFTAKADGQLSDMLSVASRYTKAEAYGTDGQRKDVKLHFNSGVVADGFALYQNNPNPFSDYTTIEFDLPEATQATLTIMDVSGKVIKVVKTDAAKGRNSVDILSSELAGSGVLYYRLDTPTHTATKSMIIIE